MAGKNEKIQCMFQEIENKQQEWFEQLGIRYGIATTQHMVLMFVSQMKEKKIQKAIAKRFNISAAAVTMLLKRLEKNGYIIRAISKEDARQNQIEVTEKGNQIIEATKKEEDKYRRIKFKGLTEEEKDTLLGILSRVRDNQGQ